MFRETRIRLAALNTIILFIIINLFGGALYFSTYNHLFRRIDSLLTEVANRSQNDHYRHLVLQKDLGRPAERRVVYLLWDKGGQLLLQVPQGAFSPAALNKLRPLSDTQDFRTLAIEGHKYRSLSAPLPADEEFGKIAPQLRSASTLQFMINIDTESNILSDVIIIVLIGALTGGGVSLFAGFFLADRALIPIKKSWNKQQQFVADASHELRTPLSVAQSQLELLFRHPDHTIEQESERIYSVLMEVKRMIKLVSQLLTFARSDSNQLELELNQFYFDELITSTIQQMKPLAATKQITLEALAETDIRFYGDRERIQQLLIILLDNAIKFTPEDGSVKVSCTETRNNVTLVVEDTGLGIPAGDLPFIFDRFYRGDKARTRNGGGTGLGLAIAKWIVHAHRGEIRAESIPATGTKIHCSFPVKRSV